MNIRLALQFGIVAAAGILLAACASNDTANTATNSQAAKADSTITNQGIKPNTPSAPIGSPPGKRY